jgi:hypothetical protein
LAAFEILSQYRCNLPQFSAGGFQLLRARAALGLADTAA